MTSLHLRAGVRWASYAAATLTLAGTMVLLGNWQWDRYQDRRAKNAQLEAGSTVKPVPLTDVLPRPGTTGEAGAAPAAAKEWTMITVAGRYDSTHEMLARSRTVNGRVGFEVLTPLRTADNAMIIISRGWIEAPLGDARARPVIPSAPSGQVTVTGRLHLSESGPRPLQRFDGRIEVRRITLSQLAPQLPYPLYGAYVLMSKQAPEAATVLVPIPVPIENAWQSGAYAVQWWLFAAGILTWYLWAAYRAAQGSVHPPETAGVMGRS